MFELKQVDITAGEGNGADKEPIPHAQQPDDGTVNATQEGDGTSSVLQQH